MLDFSTTRPGDRLKVVGAGAPGFAKLGDTVTVTSCRSERGGRCDVVHDTTGEPAYFALSCGAARLERI